jgi:hypothetical protein
MSRPRQDEPETPADHWKNHLAQKTTRMPTREDFRGKPGSTAGSRRRWSVVVRNLAVAAFFGAVGVVGWLAWEDVAVSPTSSAPAAVLECKSDGVITTEWVLARLTKDGKLPAIFDIKRLLEDEPQIREVSVQRRNDGTLAVTIFERRPVARLRVMLPGGNVRDRLVSPEGVIYDGINVGQLTYSNIPVLVDWKSREEPGRSYNVIDGFAPIAGFLDLAREKYPTVYRDWLTLSLKDYPGRVDAPGAVLRVKPRLSTQAPDSAALIEIVFSPVPADYAEELRLLGERNFSELIRQSLRTVDRVKFPAYRLDLSMENASNPRHRVPEPRLQAVSVSPRQP